MTPRAPPSESNGLDPNHVILAYVHRMDLYLPPISSFQFLSTSVFGKPVYRGSFLSHEEMRLPSESSLIAFVNRRFSDLNNSLE